MPYRWATTQHVASKKTKKPKVKLNKIVNLHGASRGPSATADLKEKCGQKICRHIVVLKFVIKVQPCICAYIIRRRHFLIPVLFSCKWCHGDELCFVDEITEEPVLKAVHKDNATAAAETELQSSRHLVPHDALESSKYSLTKYISLFNV